MLFCMLLLQVDVDVFGGDMQKKGKWRIRIGLHRERENIAKVWERRELMFIMEKQDADYVII